MTPDVLAARIDVLVCELRVLASATVQWGRVYAVKNLTDDGSSAREIRAIAANGIRKFDTRPRPLTVPLTSRQLRMARLMLLFRRRAA